MAAVAEIVTVPEVLSYLGLGSSATESEIGQVQMLKQWAEAATRRFLGTHVVQTTYTHILPPVHSYLNSSGGGLDDRFRPELGPFLRLPEYPVRSITSIHEDENALGGAASNAFPSDSELTEGTDFYLDVGISGFSKYGTVIRYNNNWSSLPGSIKVVYVAGYSAAELDGDVTENNFDASDIKFGVLRAVVDAYNDMRQQQGGFGGGGGALASERLGDYSVKYAIPKVAGTILPAEVRDVLKQFKRPVIS